MRGLDATLATGPAVVDPGRDSSERTHTARVVKPRSRRANDLGYALFQHAPPQASATPG